MLSVIYLFLVFLACVFGLLFGNSAAVGAAALSGAREGVKLTLGVAGTICLWSALQKLMAAAGLTEFVAAAFRPILISLFPHAGRDSQASGHIAENFCANLLGLGSAATPPGIAAVRRMRELSGSDRATDEMCRFVVLNTASIQLIPATVAAVRAEAGAQAPLDILPAVWLSSAVSVAAGLGAARLLAGLRHD